jgi:hypothetical protein
MIEQLRRESQIVPISAKPAKQEGTWSEKSKQAAQGHH